MARTAKTATKAATKTTTPPETRGCACGCGESVERVFKQGHDQRLISYLAEDIVYASRWDGSCMGILKTRLDRQADIQDRINKVSAYVSAKLSPALATKFESAAGRQWELQKNRDKRESDKQERRAANAAKPKRTRKSATPSEEAGDAKLATVTPIDIANPPTVKAVASNDDVDAAEAAADEARGYKPGDAIRVKVGKRVRNANVRGMSQSGMVTAVVLTTNGKETVKNEGEFEIVGY